MFVLSPEHLNVFDDLAIPYLPQWAAKQRLNSYLFRGAIGADVKPTSLGPAFYPLLELILDVAPTGTNPRIARFSID